jgi:tetratricopeptide (TPR) repeat protein
MDSGKTAIRAAAIVFAALGFIAASGSAANTLVLGGSFAQTCSEAARRAADHGIWDGQAIFACSLAIDTERLTTHERAATYVNRGSLLLVDREFAEAKSDFDTALSIEPALGEAFADRGAALIGEHDFTGAIADIDRGLALKAEEPEKSYFNRAIAQENLGDLTSAYHDYQKAAELRPNWELPRTELQRFKVTRQVE